MIRNVLHPFFDSINRVQEHFIRYLCSFDKSNLDTMAGKEYLCVLRDSSGTELDNKMKVLKFDILNKKIDVPITVFSPQLIKDKICVVKVKNKTKWLKPTLPVGTVKEVLKCEFPQKVIPNLTDIFSKQYDMPFDNKVKMEAEKIKASCFGYSKENMPHRIDFRDKCVFTIDPEDARDLDDALHVTEIQPGVYEVGVHVADVSHYVLPRTNIDSEARHRSMSTYFPHKVIPMLPEVLSNDLCSLHPGLDKLTVSVILTVNSDGIITASKIQTSVIHPKVRLDYNEATNIIENDSSTIAKYDRELVSSIQILDKIAQIFRKQRFERGALNLNSSELKFRVDNENVSTISMYLKDYKRSNMLIEEWMVVANATVAEFIFNQIKMDENFRSPIGALLRYHRNSFAIEDMIEELKNSGIVESFKGYSVPDIINLVRKIYSTDSHVNESFSLLMKMKLTMAMYVCSELNFIGNEKDAINLNHFGLSLDFYTHFTSPIRRYADLIVHRQVKQMLKSRNETDMLENKGDSLNRRIKQCDRINQIKGKSISLRYKMARIFFASFLANNGCRTTKIVLCPKFNNKAILVYIPSVTLSTTINFRRLIPWAEDCTVVPAKNSESAYLLVKCNKDAKYSLIYYDGFISYNYVSGDNSQSATKQSSLHFLKYPIVSSMSAVVYYEKIYSYNIEIPYPFSNYTKCDLPEI